MGRLSKFNFIILLFAFGGLSYSQKQHLDIIPQEEIFVNINSNLFVVGETIYYKLYCFYKETQKLSNISKIAYVTFVNDQKELVLTQKLNLVDGMSSGDYYIPPHIKTGNYKLLAYTTWINNNENPAFALDIYIVNPFRRTNGIRSNETANKLDVDSLVLNRTDTMQMLSADDRIQLTTNQDSYKTRSKVQIDLTSFDQTFGNGNYSISVRKVDSVAIKNNNKEVQLKIDGTRTLHLPEIRGEIVSGTVRSKEGHDVVPNKIIGLSISGNPNIYKNVRTDKNGKFYFSLYENYKEGNLAIQLIDPNSDNYDIQLDDRSFKNFETLVFSKLYLNPEIEHWLTQKSINNQVESAFFSSKKDSIIEASPPKLFYGEANEEFILDDYTRFPTIKETFIEVVKGAGIRNENGVRKIGLINSEVQRNNLLPDIETLVLIDGIPILNHEILIDYKTNEIEKISVVKSLYYYGPSIYNGIVALETKERNFSLPNSVPHTAKKIVTPLPQKIYFSNNHNSSKSSIRIPDFRTQLLWLPEFNLKDNKQTIDFYTSDIIGTYEVLLQGYTENGKFVELNRFIEVVSY